MNMKGIKFIHERSRPLEVDSAERAAEVLASALAKRAQAKEDKRCVPPDDSFIRHLVWLIGFDTLVEQRADIHRFVDKLVD